MYFPRRVPQELQLPSYGLTPLRSVTCRLTGVFLCHLSVWVCPSTLPCLLLPSGLKYCCTTQSALFLECFLFAQRYILCHSRLSSRWKACVLTSVLKYSHHPAIFGFSIRMTSSSVVAFILSISTVSPRGFELSFIQVQWS